MAPKTGKTMDRRLVAYAFITWDSAAGHALIVGANSGFAGVTDNTSGTGGPTGEVLFTPDDSVGNWFPAATASPFTPGTMVQPIQQSVEVEDLPANSGVMLDAGGTLTKLGTTWQVISAPPASVAPGMIVYPPDPVTGGPRLTNILQVDTYGQVTGAPVGGVPGKFNYKISVFQEIGS